MAQQEIYNIMKKNPKLWFNLSQLSKMTGVNNKSTSRALIRMLKYNEVEAIRRIVDGKSILFYKLK
jgi:hypothetical protein